MQHVTIIAVGKAAGFYAEGVAEYAKRLQGLCRFAVKEVAEEPLREKNPSQAGIAATLQKEGERILQAVPKGAQLAALCVEGKAETSEGFAARLAQMALEGEGSVAFAIGGSHGLSPGVKAAAGWKLSLSGMTLPHQLARLVLAEQVYRAFMINTGRTYHK